MASAIQKQSRRLRLLLLGGALLVPIIIWLSYNISWEEKEIDIGQSSTARKDNFLAAKYLLRVQGVETETLRSFSVLDNLHLQGEKPRPDDTLILINSYKLLQGSRLQNLLTWVEGGGTVIASTTNLFIGNNTATRDQLFDHIGVEVPRDLPASDDDSSTDETADNPEDPATEPTDESSPDDEREESAEAEELLRCGSDLELTPLTFTDEATPVLIDFSAGQPFTSATPPRLASGDNSELFLAQFGYGQGRIVVSSDPFIWSNSRIDCHDHAYALWKLINPPGKVWFLINQEAPSLWVLLWRASPAGAVAGIIALLLWLWAKARRFGPVRTRTQTDRRSLAEHIRASATLLWRRQQHPYLVAQLRERLCEQLQQSYPQFAGLAEQEQIHHLHSLTGLAPELIQQALFRDQVQSPQDFTETVAHLQTIRKHL